MLAIAYLAGSDDGLGYGQLPQNVGVICAWPSDLLGDMAGAFTADWHGPRSEGPGLDQYDFFAGAFLLTYLAYPSWVISTYLEGEAIVGLVVLLIFVPVLHRLVNIIGFKMGTKKEPW